MPSTPTESDSAARAARIRHWLTAFDAQGWHRTGTAGDAACAAWLRAEIAATGASPIEDGWGLQRRDVKAAWVEIGGKRIEGLPLFDAPLSGGQGVSGTLGPLGSGAAIGYSPVPVHGPHAALEAARSAQGTHQALLLCTDGKVTGLAPRNAYAFKAPFGPPALMLSNEHADWLAGQSDQGAQARLVTDGVFTPAQSSNLRVEIAGRTSCQAPLLVMTPRSGWYHCAGERGGGLAAWLEALRAVQAAPPDRDVVFLATSGHEIGHYGLDEYLDGHPHQVEEALAWVHLGASIGAAQNAEVHAYGSDAELLSAARTAFDGHTVSQHFRWNAPGEHGSGEARNIAQRGGRFFSLAGQSDWFHQPCDRWPDSVDVEALTGITGAVAALVAHLAGSAS